MICYQLKFTYYKPGRKDTEVEYRFTKKEDFIDAQSALDWFRDHIDHDPTRKTDLAITTTTDYFYESHHESQKIEV